MNKRILYTIIYPFMSSKLGLSGYEKEAFAVIFNFWLKAGEKPVRASLTVIQRITGGTRPSITRAIAALLEKNLISAEKQPGKPTLYTVKISPEVLNHFKATYKQKPVMSVNQRQLNCLTTTGSVGEPRNKLNGMCKIDTTLHVKKQDEITTGGLPEAK